MRHVVAKALGRRSARRVEEDDAPDLLLLADRRRPPPRGQRLAGAARREEQPATPDRRRTQLKPMPPLPPRTELGFAWSQHLVIDVIGRDRISMRDSFHPAIDLLVLSPEARRDRVTRYEPRFHGEAQLKPSWISPQLARESRGSVEERFPRGSPSRIDVRGPRNSAFEGGQLCDIGDSLQRVAHL